MKEYNEKLIEAFLTEYKVIDIVRITGLSKTTIYKYKNDPAFQAVLTERRSAMVSSAVDRMTQYMNENVEALQSVIRDPETSAQTKVNAIQVMLNHQLEDYHRRKKEAEQARREAEKNRPAPPPRKNCPFRESMQTDCKREQCALFDGNGCTLARLTAAKETEGLQCPFSKYNYKCRTDCALYKGGCTLTGITTTTESEDK